MFVWFSAIRSCSQISWQFELVYHVGGVRRNLLVHVLIHFPSFHFPKMKLGDVIFGAGVKEIHSSSSSPLCKLLGFSFWPCSCFWYYKREKWYPRFLSSKNLPQWSILKKQKKKLLSILLEDWSARDHSGNEGNEYSEMPLEEPSKRMSLSEARACSWLAPSIPPNSCVSPSITKKGYHIGMSVISREFMS